MKPIDGHSGTNLCSQPSGVIGRKISVGLWPADGIYVVRAYLKPTNQQTKQAKPESKQKPIRIIKLYHYYNFVL